MSRAFGPHMLDAVETGTFALDGGGMFGVVPRPLWEKHAPADARHRVRLAARALLVRTGERNVLVDTGFGSRWSAKQQEIYGFETSSGSLDEGLSRLGLDRAAVTDVVLTHLHFDHAGGAVELDASGRERVAFPRATFHLQRRNWAWAHQPSERDAAAYRPEDWRALELSGRLHLVDGEIELFPDIWLVPSEGHTAGMQMVRVEGDGRWLVHCSDVIPTAQHLHPAWGTAFDLHPLTVAEEKKMLVAQALDEGGVLFFGHDPRVAACTVREDGAEVAVCAEECFG